MPLELTTGVPSFLIWLRPSDNLLATVSSCHQLWLMNCDILLLCLSLPLCPCLTLFTLYRLLKCSPLPPILNTPWKLPSLLPSLLLSLTLSVLSLLPVCCPLSCTIHLANLIFGVDRALNRGPVFSHTFVSIFRSLSLSFSFPLSLFPSASLPPSLSLPFFSESSDNEIRLQPLHLY